MSLAGTVEWVPRRSCQMVPGVRQALRDWCVGERSGSSRAGNCLHGQGAKSVQADEVPQGLVERRKKGIDKWTRGEQKTFKRSRGLRRHQESG